MNLGSVHGFVHGFVNGLVHGLVYGTWFMVTWCQDFSVSPSPFGTDFDWVGAGPWGFGIWDGA